MDGSNFRCRSQTWSSTEDQQVGFEPLPYSHLSGMLSKSTNLMMGNGHCQQGFEFQNRLADRTLDEQCYPLLREILRDSPGDSQNGPVIPESSPNGIESLHDSTQSNESPPSPRGSNSSFSKAAKKSVRKNPWGTKTYSDLITYAIESQPSRQATLQQIYDFIVENFEYFRIRNDATSSVGWKVSRSLMK
ncbi:forkhead box O6 [Cichlidogyrus casuarinus]|uniref:Forkhead box O6 n=1 Tax=Cichlidogyrus casuarinus TaxID=1844966 RepID=A0ABD2Q8R0_9PLAT